MSQFGVTLITIAIAMVILMGFQGYAIWKGSRDGAFAALLAATAILVVGLSYATSERVAHGPNTMHPAVDEAAAPTR